MLSELSDLHGALERSELVPCFQPIVELHTGRLAGFEVLTRWQHPQHGLVLPENLISLAEDNGLIGALMQQVFRKAFQSAPMLPSPLVIAINVSPIQLTDLTLPSQIRELAESSSFSLTHVTVEITESALLGNLDRAKNICTELKDLGCTLALDDFGTGYSSLAHLQALPFDILKIDRSFVAKMTSVRDSRKIVAAIAGLGHSLGLITVAEGIETEEQADMLLWLGCELGQGWLYGRPQPPESIAALVAAPDRPMQLALSNRHGENWAASSLEALPTQRLAQLQAIYDGAPVGLCFLDRNLRYVSINRYLAEMNGAPVIAHIGKTPKEMAPLTFAISEPYLMRALHGEAVTGVEVARPSSIPGDRDRMSLASYQPAWDEAGEVIGISISVVDTTESSRASAALSESDNHQRHLNKENRQMPWIMDAKGNSVQVSSQWIRSNTLRKQKVLGWLDAVHPDDLEPTRAAMNDCLLTGNLIDIKYRIKNKDGLWQWIHSQGSPCYNPAGDIIRWYGTIEDIAAPPTAT